MKTKTVKVFGKKVAVYGNRNRVAKNRFGVSRGTTFTGLHLGKASHYLHLPILSQRSFGGVKDIVKI